MAKRAVVTYTCNPCKAKTGKNITGERIVVGDRVFDVCAKDRKVVDAYVKFDSDYGISVRQAEREARKAAELEASVLTAADRRTATSAGSNGQQTRRYECGLCRENGETRVVAHNSRSWHAGHHHGGLRASEIEWTEA